MKSVIYLRSVWDDEEGQLDVRVSYRTADRTVSALLKAMDYVRAQKDSLGGSLRDFFLEDACDSDRYVTVDYFDAQEPATPVCDDLEVVVDEADRIHFLPFQLQMVMSAEEWSAVSSLWRPWLANAPFDEDDRAAWQVCLTKAEFLGQPG